MLDEFQRDEAMVHLRRGIVLERAHRMNEAVAEYRRAIARYPYLREAHEALGSYYQRFGLLAKAVEELRLIVNLEDDFLAHFNLGYVLRELGRHDEALAAFQRCQQLAVHDPAIHYEIGHLRFLQNNYLDALGHLSLALQQYDTDWEIHMLRGRCLLELGRLVEAQISFQHARSYTLRESARLEVDRLIAAVARYREAPIGASLKDQLYANHGVLHLGSAQDDGLLLREASEYHFTYPDIATTLRRFTRLVAHCGWQFTSVVALDRLASPLASTLARLLQLELKPMGAQCGERPLMIMAIGREAELLEIASERTKGKGFSFCLGLNWRRRDMLPDASGVMVRGACSVPWEPEFRRLRALARPAAQVDLCINGAAEQILAATDELGDDSTSSEQLAYYTNQHRLLRFL